MNKTLITALTAAYLNLAPTANAWGLGEEPAPTPAPKQAVEPKKEEKSAYQNLYDQVKLKDVTISKQGEDKRIGLDVEDKTGKFKLNLNADPFDQKAITGWGVEGSYPVYASGTKSVDLKPMYSWEDFSGKKSTEMGIGVKLNGFIPDFNPELTARQLEGTLGKKDFKGQVYEVKVSKELGKIIQAELGYYYNDVKVGRLEDQSKGLFLGGKVKLGDKFFLEVSKDASQYLNNNDPLKVGFTFDEGRKLKE